MRTTNYTAFGLERIKMTTAVILVIIAGAVVGIIALFLAHKELKRRKKKKHA